jgi:hemolysin III
MHAWAFLAAIPAGLYLILSADHSTARVAASIYIGSLLLVFGTSAAYHGLAQSYKARRIMQKLDHSMIFILIGGSYVPFCLLVLSRGWGLSILAVVGAIGLVGIAIKIFDIPKLRKLGYALYIVMGWVAVIAAPALWGKLTLVEGLLLAAGGVAYTAGFPILLLRRPDPWPTVFGYHEIWHGLVVLAAGLHFGAVALVVA